MALPTDARLPEFARRLQAGSEDVRKTILESQHPDYVANIDHWTVMLDAFEGTGGFADGSYLYPYRFEELGDYSKRKEMARYHNYVETIIDLYCQHVFTTEPERTTTSEELRDWWSDVDGKGSSMSAFMRGTVGLALAAGHTGILEDMTRESPAGPAKADQKARPFLTKYLATSILDWRTDNTEVTGIKLQECVPPNSIAEELPDEEDETRYLLWDQEGWARFDHKGELLEADVPELGVVPFEVIRPKPSLMRPFIGRSLFSNAKLVKALFNRHSEEDQVLRDQAFSILTVQVDPQNGDVEAARKQMGEQIGTSRGIVVAGEIGYISPDMAVPAQVRENSLQIIRELYRVAHMRYERDSLQAESAEAIRLQFKELNEMLQGLAAELQRVELALARFFFLWTSPTKEAGEQAFDAANVVINYPDEFFLADLMLDLEGWGQAIAMDLGLTMQQRLKKKAVRRIEPELTPDEAEKIDAEIDAQPHMQTAMQDAAETLRAGAQKRLSGLANTTSAAKDVNAVS